MPDRGEFFNRAEDMMALYSAGRYAEALRVTERLAADFPEQAGSTSLWRLCLLSRAGRTAEALEVMSSALQQGLWWGQSALRDDEDLKQLQGLPAYEAMAAECKRRQAEAQKNARPEMLVRLPAAPGPYPLIVALHGRQSSAAGDLARWEPVVGMGWMLAMFQSSQCSGPSAFCWDNAPQARDDIGALYRKLADEYPIDGQRVVIGGFSQGAALAIQVCMRGPMPARGFLAVVPGQAALEGLQGFAHSAPRLRGYLVSGGRDPRKDVFTQIHELLNRNGIPCEMEEHPEMGHAFPPDFDRSIVQALKFLFA